MSATLDWVGKEAAIEALLDGAPRTRTRLLASLGAYSAGAVSEARRLGPLMPSAAECAAALEWLLHPVFICGHQRSGTTLLQNLLDGHPQLLALPSEGTYLTSFAYVARTSPGERDLNRFAAEWIARCVDPNFEPHFRLGRATANGCPAVDFARALFGWQEALRRRVTPRLAPLLALAAAFRATTTSHRAPLLWVEKTPQNERFVACFAPFARARFIHVVRDPRATLASLRELYRTDGFAAFDTAEHARAIGRSLHLAHGNSRRLGARYLVVRYEDLLSDPAQQVERVRQFLDIAPDPTLLTPTAAGHAVRANSSFAPGAAGVIEQGQRPAVLSAAELASLGAHAASAARRFGYDVPLPSRTARCATHLRDWPRHALRRSRAVVRAVVRPLRDAMRR